MPVLRQRQVLPVIHYLNSQQAHAEADLAFRVGADGVFLISHNGRNAEMLDVSKAIKARYPHKQIGLNLLGEDALTTLLAVEQAGLDLAWADDPGVTSAGWTELGAVLAHYLRNSGTTVTFFGSVAFKYQAHEPEPGRAAELAAMNGMLPTTSGPRTGEPPALTKAQRMHQALAGGRLAVASGMSPENVADYLPYFTHYLVATGVASDKHHFDESLLADFIRRVHEYAA